MTKEVSDKVSIYNVKKGFNYTGIGVVVTKQPVNSENNFNVYTDTDENRELEYVDVNEHKDFFDTLFSTFKSHQL